MMYMKKLGFFLSIFVILLPSLSGCMNINKSDAPQIYKKEKTSKKSIDAVRESSNNDKKNLTYLVSESLENSKYPILVEDVAIQKMSKEYYDELEFNSQQNVYFGYTEQQLLEMFDTSEYSFIVNSDGKSTVGLDSQLFKENYLNKSVKNIAIGGGVMLICASISVVLSGGATTPMVVMVVVSEMVKEATIASLISGIVTVGIEKFNGKTNNEILESSILSASEGFKYAATFSGATKILTSAGTYISTSIYPKVNKIITQRQAIQKGGSYRELFSEYKGILKQNGLEIHHIPANASSSETVMSRVEGPSILITKIDHKKTASYGSSLAAKQYRAKQAKYIEQGNWKKAFDMDVKDIRTKFGKKYDKALKEAEKAAKEKGLW